MLANYAAAASVAVDAIISTRTPETLNYHTCAAFHRTAAILEFVRAFD